MKVYHTPVLPHRNEVAPVIRQDKTNGFSIQQGNAKGTWLPKLADAVNDWNRTIAAAFPGISDAAFSYWLIDELRRVGTRNEPQSPMADLVEIPQPAPAAPYRDPGAKVRNMNDATVWESDGWLAHPHAPGWYYKTDAVKSFDDLREAYAEQVEQMHANQRALDDERKAEQSPEERCACPACVAYVESLKHTSKPPGIGVLVAAMMASVLTGPEGLLSILDADEDAEAVQYDEACVEILLKTGFAKSTPQGAVVAVPRSWGTAFHDQLHAAIADKNPAAVSALVTGRKGPFA